MYRLAKETGIAHSTIQIWNKNDPPPKVSRENIRKCAKALDCSPVDLDPDFDKPDANERSVATTQPRRSEELTFTALGEILNAEAVPEADRDTIYAQVSEWSSKGSGITRDRVLAFWAGLKAARRTASTPKTTAPAGHAESNMGVDAASLERSKNKPVGVEAPIGELTRTKRSPRGKNDNKKG
jgi:hypothetical protein